MLQDVLEPINSIKTSINKNDQLVWAHQAAKICYNQGVEKLKEKHDILNKEMIKIKENIAEIRHQDKVLSSCYQIQLASLPLSQEALINQRLYRNHMKEKIKNKNEEYTKLIDQHSNEIQKSKEKLERTNSTYQKLQKNKTELKKSKINCLNLMKEIENIKKINAQKKYIRQKLFTGDIVAFAKSWLIHKKYVENLNILRNEKQIEREWMIKLVKTTEQLQKKQKENLYKRDVPFSMLKFQYPANDVAKANLEKPLNREMPFPDIKEMFRKQEQDLSSISKQHSNDQNRVTQKVQYNGDKSKIRVLENRTLNLPRNVAPVMATQSKEERSRAIEEKLKKVAQNIKKSITSHNSKRKIAYSSKGSPCGSQRSIKSRHSEIIISVSQESNPTKRVEGNQTDVTKNFPKDTKVSEALNTTQNNLTEVGICVSQESNIASQVSKANSDRNEKLLLAKGDTSKFFKAPENMSDGVVESSQETQQISSPSKDVHLVKKINRVVDQYDHLSMKSSSQKSSKSPSKNVCLMNSAVDRHIPVKSSSQESQKPLTKNFGLANNKGSVDRYGGTRMSQNVNFGQKSRFFPVRAKENNILYKKPETTDTEKPQLEGAKSKDNSDAGKKANNTSFEMTNENLMNSMGMGLYAFGNDTQLSPTSNTTQLGSTYKSPEFDANFTNNSPQPADSDTFYMGFGSQGNFLSFKNNPSNDNNQSTFFSFK